MLGTELLEIREKYTWDKGEMAAIVKAWVIQLTFWSNNVFRISKYNTYFKVWFSREWKHPKYLQKTCLIKGKSPKHAKNS